jgi:two-component system chemotaxis response regulator CheY
MSVNLSMPVLVVDDYPFMAMIVITLLKQIGFEHIEGAEDGKVALQKLARKKYGLVISDETMDLISGNELLRAMRANPATSDTPFLMLTAPAAAQPEAPGADTIAKPFNARTLQTKIEALLAA